MAQTRSPTYPAIDLSKAIKLVELVFKAEKRNRMARSVMAQHLGYSGINGKVLSLLATLRGYGLIDGSADEIHVSEDAIKLLVPGDDSTHIFEQCAFRPSLFSELRSAYPDTPSEKALVHDLVTKRKFNHDAAKKASQAYLSNMV